MFRLRKVRGKNAIITRDTVFFSPLRRQNRRVSVRSRTAAVFHAEFHAGCSRTHGTWWFRRHDHKHVTESADHHHVSERSRVHGQRQHEFRSKHSSTVLSFTVLLSHIKLIRKSFPQNIFHLPAYFNLKNVCTCQHLFSINGKDWNQLGILSIYIYIYVCILYNVHTHIYICIAL